MGARSRITVTLIFPAITSLNIDNNREMNRNYPVMSFYHGGTMKVPDEKLERAGTVLFNT